MTPDALPLLSLMPVSDAEGHWVVLEVCCAADEMDKEALGVLFNEIKLGTALAGLGCVLPLASISGLNPDAAAPAPGVVILLPAEGLDEVDHDSITKLRGLGYRFMLQAPPATSAATEDFSLAFAAAAVDGATPSLLAHRPGPHLVQGVVEPNQLPPLASAGFQWFGGNWPLHRAGHGQSHDGPSRARLLKLLALLARDADAHELEAAIKQDPALAYQLLKLVNSVAFGLSRSIDNLSQALMALGRRQLQRWLQLLLYAHPEGSSGSSGRAAPLMPWAALRGALMENLSASLGGDSDERDSAYMIGTFSLLDVLLGMSMTDLLKPLNLSAPVAEALLNHAGGRLGLLLGAAEAAECGDLTTLATNLETLGLSTTAFANALCESYRWAIQVGKES